MRPDLHIAAPAKINLSLRVLGRRCDGFHEIETLMAPLALEDTLVLAENPRTGIAFTCSDSALPGGDDNLVVRAARLFFLTTGLEPQVRIHLEKRIPHGAGLGGGSSDAASTLLGLNALLATGLSRERLMQMAAELGSDVAFFIGGTTATCRGRGEQVTPCAVPAPLPLVLLKPPFGVSTPWAYAQWDRTRLPPQEAPAPPQWRGLMFVNDLEPVVFAKYPFLAVLKRWLLAQPETAVALMSGSGSTLFAVLHAAAAGEALCQRAVAEFGPTLWTMPTAVRASNAGRVGQAQP